MEHVNERHELIKGKQLGEVCPVDEDLGDDGLKLSIVVLICAVGGHVLDDVTKDRIDLATTKKLKNVLDPDLGAADVVDGGLELGHCLPHLEANQQWTNNIYKQC